MKLWIQTLIQGLFPSLWEDNMLFSWATTLTILILAVLVLRYAFQTRLSPRVKYALWSVVLVRALLPVQLPMDLPVSGAQLPSLIQILEQPFAKHISDLNTPSTPIYTQTPDLPEENVVGSALEQLPNDPYHGQYIQQTQDGDPVVTTIPIWTRYQHYVYVWTLGVGLLAAVFLASNLRFAWKLRRSRRSFLVQNGNLPLYIADCIPSPCLFGLFRPAIYLTPGAAALPEEQRQHILAHEQTHYRQKDHVWSALRCLALALHWYNPLVWLAVYLSKRDGELSCDAGAVKMLGEAERIPYGRTLVSLVAHRSLRPGDLLSCSTSMAEGKKSIQERISQLVTQPETKKTALFAVVALAALAVVFTFGDGQKQQAERAPYLYSYSDLRTQIQHAQAIYYSPPPTSSVACTDPITDADLLEEARELLMSARDLMTPVADTTWENQVVSAPTISLMNADTSMSRYYLCTFKGCDYLISPAYLNAETYTPVAVFSENAGIETALADLAQQQSKRNAAVSSEDASTSTPVTAHMVDQAQRLQNLEPDQIQSVYGGPYQKDSALANSILTTLKEEAKNLIPTPEPQLYDLYSLWEVYLQIDEEDFWELSAGTVSSIVAVRIDQDTIYFHAPKLYELIRQWWTPPDNVVTVTTPAVLQTMEQVLAEEKEAAQESSEFLDAYRSVQLISLHCLASFDNQADGSTVNIYGYDSGFVMDDLSNISWTGDAWVDGQMLYHPDNAYQNLITVEQNGNIAQYVTVTNDFPLDPESYASHTDSQLSLGEYAALLLGSKG